jgi:hypothetical protein
MANLPLLTEGEIYTRLLDRLRQAEEGCYILGHFYKAQDDFEHGQGFLGVGEMMHMTIINVTNLATKSIRTEGGFR